MEFMFNYSKEAVANRQQSLDLKQYKAVMVIGVGGIGNWASLIMALTGNTENIILVDPDVVECSNLNRTCFRLCDVGRPKVWGLKYLILERRPEQSVTTFEDIFKLEHLSEFDGYDHDDVCIVDCRDDLFDDIYEIPETIKMWKIGYDGLEITIDGNPRKTKVWGQAQGYAAVPSFACSAMLAANLVINHMVMPDVFNTERECIGGPCDKFNTKVTYHTGTLIQDMYDMSRKEYVEQETENETEVNIEEIEA